MLTLKDTTIVIPARIDSPEREANLNALLLYFRKGINLRIILLEADEQRHYFLKDSYPEVTYRFVKDNDPIFYRTYYLNRLIEMTETPIVGIWDTDVIVPVGQIEEAVKAIREGKTIMSFPYDGHFYAVSSELSETYRQTTDIQKLIDKKEQLPLICGSISVGGAFFVDRMKYREMGGENEYFYGWGPEDRERVTRVEKLQAPIYRSEGPLFHLYHPVGMNSQYANKKLERRNQKEFMRVCRMELSELSQHIDSWKYPSSRWPEIVRHLILTAPFEADLGLYHGKMGLVLFFFHYFRHTTQSWYETLAYELLADVKNELHADLPVGFAEGLCGIGWGLEYLVHTGFLEGDTSEALAEFDAKIMETDPLRLTDLSLETGLEGILQYVSIRLLSSIVNKRPNLPFDTRYLKDLYQRISTIPTNQENNGQLCVTNFMQNKPFIYDPQKTWLRFLNKVVPDTDNREWSSGLADGCSGYVLKEIVS